MPNQTKIEKNTPLHRCGWVSSDPIYLAYHDNEWGVPELDSRALFAKLCLDGQQAGLSWLTILKKQQNFEHKLTQIIGLYFQNFVFWVGRTIVGDLHFIFPYLYPSLLYTLKFHFGF